MGAGSATSVETSAIAGAPKRRSGVSQRRELGSPSRCSSDVSKSAQRSDGCWKGHDKASAASWSCEALQAPGSPRCCPGPSRGEKTFGPRRLGCGVGNGAALRRAPPVVPTAARSGRRSARASTKGIANQLWDTGGTAARALFVGLAVLSLLSGASRSQPLLCVIDDAQWLDSASARAMALAARRLDADAVAVVFATRSDDSDDTLSGLPDLLVGSLMDADAAALLRQAAPRKTRRRGGEADLGRG